MLADFNHLTPVVGDKVEGWCATEDTCSFKVQGFTVNLQMIEKVEHKLIKVTAPTARRWTLPFGSSW